MSPDFAKVVDPIFQEVIDVVGRIQQNQIGDPDTVRSQIDARFRNADSAFGEKQDWQLAKYALVSWIDETLKAAPWDGRHWWIQNSMEFLYFRTNDAAVQFFVKGKEAASLTQRDALEVFYVCVALGFRGLYQLQEKAFLAESKQLPREIEDWAAKAASGIKYRSGRDRFQELRQSVPGAPALNGKYQLIAASLIMLAVPAAAFVIFWYYYHNV